MFLLANNMIPIDEKVVIYNYEDIYGTFPYIRYKVDNLNKIKRLIVDVKNINIPVGSNGKIDIKEVKG